MIVYCLERFLVNLYGIALAEFGDELIFLEALVVVDNLVADVCPFFGTLLKHLA